MCAPAIAALGGVVSAAGSVMAGMQQAAMANYSAKVAGINANAAVREANAKAGQILDQYGELAGQQSAAFGAAGVDPASGSAEMLRLDTEKKRRFAFESQIWEGQTERTAYQNMQKQYQAEAKAAKTSGIIGGFTGLLGAAGDAFGSASSLGTALSLGTAAPAAAAPALAPASLIPKPRPKPKPYLLDPAGRIIGGI